MNKEESVTISLNKSSNKTLGLAVIFILGFICIVLVRFTYRSTYPNSFDALNYLLALEEFNVEKSQPQPPGYPLYIVLGRVFNFVITDPYTAMVILSQFFGLLLIFPVYWLGREMFSHKAGVITALIMVVNPSIWYQSAVCAPYTMDLFFSTLYAWLCYRAIQKPQTSTLIWSSIVLGLVVGVRPQNLIIFSPLFIYSLRRYPWKSIILACVILGVVVSVFFVPVVVMTGGIVAYLKNVASLASYTYSLNANTLSSSTNRLSPYIKKTIIISELLFKAVGELVLPFVIIGFFAQVRDRRLWKKKPTLIFMLFWVIPALLLFILLWPGNPGTVLVCVTPFFLLAGQTFARLLEKTRNMRLFAFAMIAGVVIWQFAVFAFLSDEPFGKRYRSFENYSFIVWQENYFKSKLNMVAKYPSEDTIIFADEFRHLQVFLPQYHARSRPIFYRDDSVLIKSIMVIENGKAISVKDLDPQEIVPANMRWLIIFDLPPGVIYEGGELIEEKTVDGYTLGIVDLQHGISATWTYKGLQLDTSNEMELDQQ